MNERRRSRQASGVAASGFPSQFSALPISGEPNEARSMAPLHENGLIKFYGAKARRFKEGGSAAGRFQRSKPSKARHRRQSPHSSRNCAQTPCRIVDALLRPATDPSCIDTTHFPAKTVFHVVDVRIPAISSDFGQWSSSDSIREPAAGCLEARI